MSQARCIICSGTDLVTHADAARCLDCGVLLFWPYPEPDSALIREVSRISKDVVRRWYVASAALNHSNFTNMLGFAIDESHRDQPLDILDYGGGGGQFAVVCRSLFPRARVHITDLNDAALMDEWRPFNLQIPFRDFAADRRQFDFIFLNDVFEHVSGPVAVLRQLADKLKPGGRLFIDTPKQFWIYPVARRLAPALYAKILRGTVTRSHLQIWSSDSFRQAVAAAGLRVTRYEEVSEYSMPPDFYLRNMGITNPLLRLAGRIFYRNARHLARNKILCVLTRPPED